MAIEATRVSSADLMIYERPSDLDLLYWMTPTDEMGNVFLGKGAPHWFIFVGRGTVSWFAPWGVHCVNEFGLQSEAKLRDRWV